MSHIESLSRLGLTEFEEYFQLLDEVFGYVTNEASTPEGEEPS